VPVVAGARRLATRWLQIVARDCVSRAVPNPQDEYRPILNLEQQPMPSPPSAKRKLADFETQVCGLCGHAASIGMRFKRGNAGH